MMSLSDATKIDKHFSSSAPRTPEPTMTTVQVPSAPVRTIQSVLFPNDEKRLDFGNCERLSDKHMEKAREIANRASNSAF